MGRRTRKLAQKADAMYVQESLHAAAVFAAIQMGQEVKREDFVIPGNDVPEEIIKRMMQANNVAKRLS